MKLLLYSFTILPLMGADWYVRSGASGNGTSWSGAWGNTTSIVWSSLSAGDTVWIAGGSYGALAVGKSGTSDTVGGRIYVKRATASAHGSDTGWSAGYDAQVSLASISWGSLNVGSYVTIDGQVTSGIAVSHGDGDSSASITFDRGVSYVTLRYLDIGGPGDTVGFHHTGDDRGIDVTAWNGSTYDAVNYLLVERNKIHGACTQIWNMNASNGVWQYNEIYNSTDSTGNPCHPNIFVTASSSNVTFRYNSIHTYDAEGIMILNGGHGSLYVYGNTWYDGLTYARVIETQDGVNGPVYFYNNTAVGLWAGVNTANGGSWASGTHGRNNIWWNMDGQGLTSEDYNLCTGTCSGANSISSATTSPFVSLAGNDFRLTSTVGAKYPRNKGTSLGSPYDSDPLGVTRGADGTWDIGAYEYSAGGTAPTITSSSPLPAGTVGAAYSQTLTATGDATITWTVTSGSLPAGLSLSSGGAITGTPTTAGTSAPTVTATNSSGSDAKALSITINAAPSGPTAGVAGAVSISGKVTLK